MNEEVAEKVEDAPAEAEAPSSDSMFDPSQAETAETDEATSEETPEEAPSGDRPDWLMEKYKTPEDQAKAYNEMYKQFSKKTDDLRAEVKDEVKAEYGKEIGVPDEIDGYEYPEGIGAPGEEMDTALKTWAKENNVAPEGFQQLAEMYANSIANPAEEFKKLGSEEEANLMVERVNKFAGKAFGEEDHSTISKIMQTADGVKFMDRLMGKQTQSGIFRDEGKDNSSANLTREGIREKQADPRFGEDPVYTQNVRNMWEQYTSLPPEKQR